MAAHDALWFNHRTMMAAEADHLVALSFRECSVCGGVIFDDDDAEKAHRLYHEGRG